MYKVLIAKFAETTFSLFLSVEVCVSLDDARCAYLLPFLPVNPSIVFFNKKCCNVHLHLHVPFSSSLLFCELHVGYGNCADFYHSFLALILSLMTVSFIFWQVLNRQASLKAIMQRL